MHSYKNEFYIRNLIHKNGKDVCKRDGYRKKRDGENDYEKFIGTEPNNQNNSGCRLPQFSSISMKLSMKKRWKKEKQMGKLKPIQTTATTTPTATAAVAIVVDESNTFRIFIMIRCSFIHSGTWYKLHIRFMSA